MFREHVAVGAIISMIACVAVYSYALLTDPLLLALLFVVTVIGSFLPDVDSDSGMPFYLVFGVATLAATGVVALYTLNSAYAADWRYLLGIPAAALFFFWFVVGTIVKKCTKHRGMFHSLPALLIASAATFLLARHYGVNDTTSLIFAVAMGLGFLSHLVLDELHSEITLDGIPFNTKESAGTAMKWFSKRRGVNVAAYLILATLLYAAWRPQPALAFYNDSDVIEIEDEAPPVTQESDDSSTGDGSGTGSGAGHGGIILESDGDGDESQPEGSSNSGDGHRGGASGGGGGSGGGGSAGGSGTTHADVLDLLISGGAISGPGAVSGSALFEDSVVGAGGSITVDGEGVRRALRGKYDLQELLLGWRESKGLSAGGLGYVAASTALRDRNVDAVSFTAERFDIRYRSRGYLFSIIPITFPVRIGVIPQASDGRVTVKLPWYRFFVREFFTARGLADDVDAIVQAEIEKAAGTDLTAALFLVVAEYVRAKVGTVGDTVQSAP